MGHCPPFDQWGHPAMLRRDRRGLSEPAVIAIVGAHLLGAPSRHRRETAKVPDIFEEAPSAEAPEPVTDFGAEEVILQPSGVELQARYDRGLAARRGATDGFRVLDDVFEDLDQKADELLKRTEQLLSEAIGG